MHNHSQVIRFRRLFAGAASLLVVLTGVTARPASATASSGQVASASHADHDDDHHHHGHGHGRVLPASAHPHGYTLTEMARLVAPFTVSGNDPALYPNTPFQILHIPGAADVTPQGDGFVFSGSNSFTVSRGTKLYVPIFNIDDTDPVAGVFPTTHAEALRYFRRDSQLGGRGFQVVIDGRRTTLNADYLAGPVPRPPAPGSTANNIITLGAFITSLAPGTHTIVASGGVFGDLIPATFGAEFLKFEFTYSVTVVPRGDEDDDEDD